MRSFYVVTSSYLYELRELPYLGKHKYVKEFLAPQVYPLFTLEIFSADSRHFYMLFMQAGMNVTLGLCTTYACNYMGVRWAKDLSCFTKYCLNGN